MSISKRATTVPAPLVVSPSQNFYGPDGSWGTWRIQVGTPAQSFDVLVSTAASENWVPLPDGCTSSDPSACPTLRGVQPFNGLSPSGFLTNQSSTWSLTGLYALGLEDALGYQGNGQYGADVVGLNGGNSSSSGGISLPKQTVAGIAAKDYLLGIFGLGVRGTSFSSSGSSATSFVSTLRNDNLIPSLSYGFTAGAAYRNKKVLGNLVLGGYDQSRFTPSSLSFSFASADADSLTVGVQSIVATNTLAGTASFTATAGGHLSVIDSTVPHLWLPRAICDQMEIDLGLTYDNQSDLYLVNDTIHSQLKSKNPTFTFKLGNQPYDNGNGTNIQLPYAAFDLQVGWPIYSTDQNYFPIRRAANQSQYTLGRTLLQEAYLVVDYERRNFTVAQAVFTDPMPDSRIVTIKPAGGLPSGSKALSTGAIIGIAIGGAAVIIALILGIFFSLRRKRKQKQATELEANNAKHQGTGSAESKYEPIQGDPNELSADGEYRISEMPEGVAGDRKQRPHNFAHELPSPNPVFEMMGDTPTGSHPPSPYQRGSSPYQRGSPQPSPR